MYQLSNFERTAFFTSSKTPANIVLNVTLLNAPTPRVLINAYKFLQKRHPLLSVKIQKKGMFIEFSPINPNQMIVALLPPKNNVDLKQFVEEELIRNIDIKNGSLYQLTYFFDEGLKQKSNLVLTFHHSIIDGIGVINIVDELLSNCASIQENKPIPYSNPRPLTPTPETRFPKEFKGVSGIYKTILFLGRQLVDELLFRFQTIGKPNINVNQHSSNKIIDIVFSKDETLFLQHKTRQNQLTLNTLLNMAILMVVWSYFFGKDNMPMRIFTFADLRNYLSPAVTDKDCRPHTVIMRFTINLFEKIKLLDAAKSLDQKIQSSFKRNEKFIFYQMSLNVMKMAVAMKNTRMAAVALSYMGNFNLAKSYGDIKINDISGYVSTPPFGPILAGQAGIFNGVLQMNLVYQNTDMTAEIAKNIGKEIKDLLLSIR